MGKINLQASIIALCLLLSTGQLHSQIQVTQDEFYHLFVPGTIHYYVHGSNSSYDIGNTGGPNVYDFTSINLQSPNVSNNILIDNVPQLVSRYESGSVTFGENIQSIENNPVFYIKDDSMFVLGEATVFEEYHFKHYRPYELLGKFPISYGSSFSQTIQMFDTTYSLGWQLLSSNTSSSLENTVVDGYGTLQLSIGNFECLRIKKEHTGYGDKEFLYITNNGVFVGVGGVAMTDPDQGVVNGGAQVLLAATLLDVEDEKIGVESFSLGQNYPNPFNPSTTISYNLPERSSVSLKIYDILGNEITSLVNSEKEAGNYEVKFDAAGLSSGMYFYMLQSGEFTSTKKMIILK